MEMQDESFGKGEELVASTCEGHLLVKVQRENG